MASDTVTEVSEVAFNVHESFLYLLGLYITVALSLGVSTYVADSHTKIQKWVETLREHR